MTGMPVALVTGANQGIGLQIVKELCQRSFRGTIYLTARDQTRGMDAVRKLQNDGFLDVQYLNLDVNNVETIEKAADFLRKENGGLDILVNNAGVLMRSVTREEFANETYFTMRTNFLGRLLVCNNLFPLLRPHARVVNVSSTLGHLRYLTDIGIKQRLVADDLTIDELKQIMDTYEQAVRKGNYKELGYPGFPDPYGAYPMSKIAVTAMTRIQQREFDRERPQDDIIVNAAHPGYVRTSMTQNKGDLTVEQGADTPVYLALIPPTDGTQPLSGVPRGELVSNRKIVPWTKF